MGKIGLIDVDNMDRLDECYPNLALMKLSAWHKEQGDEVGWYDFFDGEHYDKVYASKVFSFTEDYPFKINASEVEKGGTGYCISLKDGREVFDTERHKELPWEVEHIYPDYDLYGITDTAYGFMSRGCPRGHELKKLQRWCNNKMIFWKCPTWEEYMEVWRYK